MSAEGRRMGRVFVTSSVDIDYFAFLAHCLEVAGFEVERITVISEGNYRRRLRSGGFQQLWLRMKMYVQYPMVLIWRTLSAPAGSIFVITSNTFYGPALVQLVGRLRGQRVFCLIYDLYPDALEVAGKVSVNGCIASILGLVTRANHRFCEATIYLGRFLRDHAVERWGPARRDAAIDISADCRLFGLEEPFAKDATDFIELHYGGQLGYMHDAECVVECVSQSLSAPDIATSLRISFNVSGAQASFLENSLEDVRGVRIRPPLPSAEWRVAVQDYQVGLVTLSPGGATVCLPSKTYAMMAGGLAIVAICPAWCDLAILVEETEAGWVVPNSPYGSREELMGPDYLQRTRARISSAEVAQDFLRVIRAILADRGEMERRRRNAVVAMRTRFHADALAVRWRDVLVGQRIEEGVGG